MATTDQRKTVPYPNLDTWTFTLESKVASILLDYFTSNYDQSNMFMGKIRSFVYTAAQYNHDPMGCANAVQDDLTNLFGYYFEESQVTVNMIYTSISKSKIRANVLRSLVLSR